MTSFNAAGGASIVERVDCIPGAGNFAQAVFLLEQKFL